MKELAAINGVVNIICVSVICLTVAGVARMYVPTKQEVPLCKPVTETWKGHVM